MKMRQISEKLWINADQIIEVISGFSEKVKKEKSVKTVDDAVAAEIEKLEAKLDEEKEFKVKETTIGDDGEEKVVEKTEKIKLRDAEDEKLIKEADKIREKIKELEGKMEASEVIISEEEVISEGYTILMSTGTKYEVRERKFMDIVRDYILTE